VFTHDSVRLSTIADVVATYTELRAAQRSLAITERTLETREETVRIERARYEGGDTDELTLRQAESELEATRALVPQQRQRVAQLQTALGVLVGMTPRELTQELDFGEGSLSDIQLPDEVPEVLPSDLLERRPDLRAAEAAIIAATEEVGVAQAQRLPSFNLNGSMDWCGHWSRTTFSPGLPKPGRSGPQYWVRLSTSGVTKPGWKRPRAYVTRLRPSTG